MATTPSYINQRINNLQSQINSIISGGGGGVPTSSDLADVLVNGNSAGTTDIDMNHQDLTNVENITLNSTTTTDITNTLTNTQIQIIDNDPLLSDPIFTKIMKNSIEVNGGDVNINRTLIQPQLISVNQTNDLNSSLSPSAVSFLDTTGSGFNSSLTATTLQLTESSGNLDATLNRSTLSFTDATGSGFVSSLSANAVVISDTTNSLTFQTTPSALTMVNTAVGSIASLDVEKLQFLGSNTTNTISNSGGQLLNVTADGNLNLSSNSGDCIIGVPNQIQLNSTNGDISLVSVNGNNSINLNALNVNSFSSAMPICFDFVELDRNYNYTSGGQTWELIWTQNLNVPYQFFTENPSNPYTSTKWRIDFTINTWNSGSGNNSPDKGRAFYIDFQDQTATFYPSAVITSTKPFCYHNANSTWSGAGSNQEFIPVTWTDYVDFNGLVATGSGNVPLKFNVYFTADNPKNFDFSYKLGLTRVNLL